MSNPRTYYLAVLGHGSVGRAFIQQVLAQSEALQRRRGIRLRIFALANSRRLLLDPQGIGTDWEERLGSQEPSTDIPRQIVSCIQARRLERVILVDNTASDEVARLYPYYIAHGCDIVSSNKRANTLPLALYRDLQAALQIHGCSYRYETNVGAGLPLIDNIRLLHLSGDNITRIAGVFSGSLSFIFNSLSAGVPFAEAVHEAISRGYAEPDPREDLSGLDVARKVLILARELDIELDLEDVEVENLVPAALRGLALADFLPRLGEVATYIEERASLCGPDEVLRYVGEVIWDSAEERATLRASLQAVSRQSALGNLRKADNCYAIYTESYGALPIVIQGAGAGPEVTARGVFGDVLRLID